MNRLLVFAERRGGLQRRDGKRERVEAGRDAVVGEREAKSVPASGEKSELLASVEGRVHRRVQPGIEEIQSDPIHRSSDEEGSQECQVTERVDQQQWKRKENAEHVKEQPARGKQVVEEMESERKHAE